MKTVKSQNIQAEINFFDEVVEKHGHFDTVSDATYELIFNIIDPYFSNTLMEAGCGAGSFGLKIKERKPNINITGIDISQKCIAEAAKNGIYYKLVCNNLENKAIFQESEFESIICPYVIHHFPDITKVMENFRYWLKPNGHLIIIDPNGSNLILKISGLLRIILSKFINTKNCASINESNKSVSEFLKNLKQFKICSLETFEHTARLKAPLFPLTLINVLVFLQKTLMKIYKKLPFVKFRGSDLIIIAQKIDHD